MMKIRNSSLWAEEGYSLFANEGPGGIQVERLARILQLNKSGFYHYFGDLDGYCTELIKLHQQKLDLFLKEVNEAKKLDPDYLVLLVKHTPMVMFQVQLTRNAVNLSFYEASTIADQEINFAVGRLWGEYLDGQFNSELAMRYYNLVRDMIYMRATFKNLNYQFLHHLVTNAKALVAQVRQHKILASGEAQIATLRL